MAILHYQTSSLPLNCTLDEFCEATKDWSCPERRKRRFYPKYRREILTLIKQWAKETHQKAEKALAEAREVRERQLPINSEWRVRHKSGKTWEDEAIEELEQELASATYRLKFKNLKIN